MSGTSELEQAGVTWMCANGNHGDATRRSCMKDGEWQPTYTGRCAGTMWWYETRTVTDCPCECHAEVTS